MTIEQALIGSRLERPDAEILLARILGRDRTWCVSHGNDILPEAVQPTWDEWTQRRRDGEPVAYITGEKEFFGHTFYVTPAVLIPRPATEALVESALELLQENTPMQSVQESDTEIVVATNLWKRGLDARTVVDIGTGSGCIAISIALARPDLHVIATDISEDALEIAAENARRLGATNVEFRLGDALDPVLDLHEPFLLVSNPPYIPAHTDLEKDVAEFEPHLALFSGTSGTDALERISAQAKQHPQCIGMTVECRTEQANHLIST